MDDAQRADYIARAREMRAKAQEATSSEVRDQYELIAEGYEFMVGLIDKRAETEHNRQRQFVRALKVMAR